MLSNSDSQFIPQKQEQKFRSIINKNGTKKIKYPLKLNKYINKNFGIWNSQQNQVYIKFLLDNKDDFQQEYLRRSRKVFNRLSKLLPFRTSQQCRSHHQKLQLRSHSNRAEDIIEYVVERMSKKGQNKLGKMTVGQYEGLEKKGFVMREGDEKEIKIVVNENFLQIW